MDHLLNTIGHRNGELTEGSLSRDWLVHMILGVKTIAAGAEFIPVPYIRAAFGTVVTLLETVEKLHKNRDDLRDLCTSTVEIVLILQSEISRHEQLASAQLMALCENFTAFIRTLQTGLQRLMQSRTTLRGRLKELLTTTSVADQLERYRSRIHELRSNFMLIAHIDTNVHVTGIYKNISAFKEPCHITNQFRHIAIGDINLLRETVISSPGRKVKIFTARIRGEPSNMTVAKYEEDDEKWTRDLRLYSRLRHPNILQLFGVSVGSGIHALIFYDELVPLAIYRQFHRPPSDLVWVCIEGILFRQFRDCSQYHEWFVDHCEKAKGLNGICVKRDSLQLCLAISGFGIDYDIEQLDHSLSLWGTALFAYPNPVTEDIPISTIAATHLSSDLPKTLAWCLGWRLFFSVLIPIRSCASLPCEIQTKLFLGSVVTQNCIYGRVDYPTVAYIPHTSDLLKKEWESNHPGIRRSPGATWERFTVLSGAFNAHDSLEELFLFSSSITWEDEAITRVSTSWLSQANMYTPESIAKTRNRYRYGVIDMLRCVVVADHKAHHLLRPEGTSQQAYIFLCPIGIRRQGTRIGLKFPESDQFYWSLEPSGSTPLTQEECDAIGLPRLKFHFFPAARFWHEYHYNALREFFAARGFDPCGDGVARMLGLSLAEIEPEPRRISISQDFKRN